MKILLNITPLLYGKLPITARYIYGRGGRGVGLRITCHLGAHPVGAAAYRPVGRVRPPPLAFFVSRLRRS